MSDSGVRFLGDRRLEIGPVDIAGPTAGSVKIEMLRSGVCGSDLHRWKETGSVRGKRAATVIGHEPVGRIIAVGQGVDDERIGSLVVGYHLLDHSAQGRDCQPSCEGGRHCPQLIGMGLETNGSNATSMILPATHALPLPPHVGVDLGVYMSCNIGTAWAAIKKAPALDGARVGVWGLGPVGQAISILATEEKATVRGFDLSTNRLQLAEKLGVEVHGRPSDLDVAFDTTGAGPALAEASSMLRQGGTIVMVGLSPTPALVPTVVVTKQLQVRGSLVYEIADWPDICKGVQKSHDRLSTVITHRFPWTEAAAAVEIAAAAESGKVVLQWQ